MCRLVDEAIFTQTICKFKCFWEVPPAVVPDGAGQPLGEDVARLPLPVRVAVVPVDIHRCLYRYDQL